MKIHKLIASGLGTGYSPFAPGTVGAALGIVVFYFLNLWLVGLSIAQPTILIINLAVIVLVTLQANYSIKKVHTEWSHDAGKIVVDEVVGVWIAVFAMPLDWHYYLYAFIIFRIFDISKPLFIRSIDKMNNDWSVMLDDILAGVYSLLVLQGLYFFDMV